MTETSTDEEILCSLFETGADFDLTAGYEDLYEALTIVATMEGLLRLSVSQVAWRVQLWRQLPACAEHYNIAYLLSHLTSDLVAVIALVNAGVDHELNPYLESISESQSALQDFFSEQTLRQGPQNVPTLKLTLPACGVDELDGIGRGQDSYVDLVFQMNTGVYSNQELTAFAEAMLAWRDDYLPKYRLVKKRCGSAVGIMANGRFHLRHGHDVDWCTCGRQLLCGTARRQQCAIDRAGHGP